LAGAAKIQKCDCC